MFVSTLQIADFRNIEWADVELKNGINILYDRLSQGQKKTVYDFIDYLLNYKK